MAKRILSRIAAAGGVATFCVGLAVVLAVAVGASTAALGATGANLVRFGKPLT